MIASGCYVSTLQIVVCAVLTCLVSQDAAVALDPDGSIDQKIDAAVAKVKPALVRIHVVSTHYRGGREMKSESSGSGAIITEDGCVVTNHHVAGHATRLTCTLSNKEELDAVLVGTDALSDISIIRLAPNERTEFPTVSFGDSSQVKVGDRVLAMGSPLALSQSVTLGIISNTEMVMPDFFQPYGRFVLDDEDVGSTVLWLGHDADIYGGNSGGPLVNLEGEVVGINEMKMGLSGAIPSNLAREIAEALIERGEVRRAWLGMEIQPQLKHTEPRAGLLIGGVVEDTPAQRAGLQSGDILVELAGEPVEIRYSEQIPRFNSLVASLPIGETAEMVVLRGGARTSLEIVPIEREEARPKTIEVKNWGITVRDLSFLAAKEMKRKNRDGVLVTSVRPGGPCGEAKPGIQARDVIVEVSGTPITSVEDLLDVTEKLLAGEDKIVPSLTLFERKTKQYLTVVEVGLKELRDPGLEVKKAWLPVATQVLTRDLAKQLGIPKRKGVRITQVYPHEVIEDTGLEVGDILTAIDGEKIDASEQEDYEVFPTMIRQYKVGSRVELTVLHQGEERKVEVELARAPKLVREMKKYEDKNFDFTARDVAFFDKASEGWKESQEGVLVSEVTPGGWGALGNLSVSDLILEIGGEPVADIDCLKKQMSEVADRKPESLVFLVLRGIHRVYLEFEPGWGRGES